MPAPARAIGPVVGAVTGETSGAFSAFHESFDDPVRGTMLNVLEFVGPPGQKVAEQGDSGAVAIDNLSPPSGALLGMVIAASPDRTRAYVVPFESMKAAFGLTVP